MSKIEWTDKTINPAVGCSKISSGCKHCYAERMARRLKSMGYPQYQRVVNGDGWTGNVAFVRKELEKSLHWKKPRKIFVGSMGDLFHGEYYINRFMQISKIFTQRPEHTFQILTKRPKEMSKAVQACYAWRPPPNVWLGVTVENQRYDGRILDLMDIPAAVRFVSVEPMLGPVDLHIGDNQEAVIWRRLHGGSYQREFIHWVICGAETGPGKRPMSIEWAFDLQEQCRAAGVPFFFKKDSKGEYPAGLAREFPKGAI